MGIFDTTFTSKTPELLASLKGQLSIHPDNASSLATSTSNQRYHPAFGAAIALILSGQAEIHSTTDQLQEVVVIYPSTSGKGKKSVSSKRGPLGGRVWRAAELSNGTTAAPILALAETLALGIHTETLSQLRELVKLTGYPVPVTTLSELSKQAEVKGRIHKLANTIYHEVKAEEVTGNVSIGNYTSGNNMEAVPQSYVMGVLNLSQKQTPSIVTPLMRLTRLMRRGGAALLIGPPGTFKTETIKRLALDTGASVVKMRGAPGVEDRDFIGCVMPQPEGPVWIDGPLPTAFTLAKQGKTILHIDEILRYHYIHLNVLVGAMDELSAQDIHAVLGPPLRAALAATGLTGEQLETEVRSRLAQETPDMDGRYYLLSLPGGEVLTCPKKNLLFAMTTNMGEDNLQTSQDIDAALLSRIHLIIEYARPERDVVMPIYEKVSGGNQALAALAWDIENATHEMTSSEQGILARALDPRKTIALIQEAAAALEDGLPLKDAVMQAAEVTALPHCVSRDSKGVLEDLACEALTSRIRQCVSHGAALGGY